VYTALLVISACYYAYRRAVGAGQWSWSAFGWILALIWVYIGISLAIGFAIISYAGDDKLIYAALPFVLGFVPVTIIAKRIQHRYIEEDHNPRSIRRDR
jgi:hypothetical protein